MSSIHNLVDIIDYQLPYLTVELKENDYLDGIDVELPDGSLISIIIIDDKYEMLPFSLITISDPDFPELWGDFDYIRYNDASKVVDKLYDLCGKIQNI